LKVIRKKSKNGEKKAKALLLNIFAASFAKSTVHKIALAGFGFDQYSVHDSIMHQFDKWGFGACKCRRIRYLFGQDYRIRNLDRIT